MEQDQIFTSRQSRCMSYGALKQEPRHAMSLPRSGPYSRPKKRLELALNTWHDLMPPDMTMLVEYKPFEPSFYATDIAEFRMASYD
jgi:hypothetical protein